MMKTISDTIGNQILNLKCGFGISYGIARKYLPIWNLVSVSDRNQNIGFGRTPLENTKIVCRFQKNSQKLQRTLKSVKNPQGLSKGFFSVKSLMGYSLCTSEHATIKYFSFCNYFPLIQNYLVRLYGDCGQRSRRINDAFQHFWSTIFWVIVESLE